MKFSFIILALSLLVTHGQQSFHQYRRKQPASASTTLKTGLVAYWSLSGNLTDSHGTNTLVGNVSPVYTTGKIHSQAITNGSRVTGPMVGTAANATWSMMLWVKTPDVAVSSKVCIGWYGGTINIEWRDADRFRVNPPSLDYYVPGQIQVATWYFVTAGYDGSAYWLSANDGTRVTLTQASAAQTTIPFGIDFDAVIIKGPAAFWTKSLSTAEVTQLYNSGSGLPYSSW